jgi:hypothetical protein
VKVVGPQLLVEKQYGWYFDFCNFLFTHHLDMRNKRALAVVPLA